MSTTKRWLDYLSAHDMVRREAHPTDRRTAFIRTDRQGPRKARFVFFRDNRDDRIDRLATVIFRSGWCGVRSGRGFASPCSGVTLCRSAYIVRSRRTQKKAETHLHQLLNEALGLVDDLGLPPEIGARLQEVIDLVEGYFGFDAAAS